MKRLFLFLLMTVMFQLMGHSQSSAVIDPRISKHYTAEQLKEITDQYPAKMKQLNFYYSSSFIIKPGVTGGTVDPSTIDITEYEHLRQEDKRARTGVNRNGAVIELLSRNELKAKYKELTASKN